MTPALSEVLPLFAVLILSLSVHEAAHAWMADRLGDPTARLLGRLSLNPMVHIDWIGTVLFPLLAIYSGLPLLGWAKPVPVSWANLQSPRRDFALVALAGPVSNVILAVIGAVVFSAVLSVARSSTELMSPLVLEVLYQFVTLNVMLAVFNMLPVPPLDGGNVLAGIVPESAARLVDALRPWGFVILYVLMFTGLLSQITRPVYLLVEGLLL